MGRFIVERYLPDATVEQVRDLVERIERLWRGDVDAVRHVRTVVIPDDEAVFCEFEAPSADVVRRVHARLGVPFDRVVAVQLTE